MVHLTSTLHLLALALIANVARAMPPPPPPHECDANYRRFNLYSATEELVSFLRVETIGMDLKGDTISKLSTCDTCGEKPLYWVLKNSVLSPIFAPTSHRDPSVETINLGLSSGLVALVTGPERNLTPAPIFCAETTITNHPTSLSANGRDDLWSVCSGDLYYNQSTTEAVPGCQKVALYINEYTSSG